MRKRTTTSWYIRAEPRVRRWIGCDEAERVDEEKQLLERTFGQQPDPVEHPMLYLQYWSKVDAAWRYMKADAMLRERERTQ